MTHFQTPPAITSAVTEENPENDWADFESNTVPSSEQSMQLQNDEQTNQVIEDDDDDDFGEFSEVQVASKPDTSSLPTVNLFLFISIQIETHFIVSRIL